MSADDVKEQLKLEREVEVGDTCQARWTNSGHYYETEVDPYQEYLEAGVMPGNLEGERHIPTPAEYFPEGFEHQPEPEARTGK